MPNKEWEKALKKQRKKSARMEREKAKDVQRKLYDVFFSVYGKKIQQRATAFRLSLAYIH